MVKFSEGDTDYANVVAYLCELCETLKTESYNLNTLSKPDIITDTPTDTQLRSLVEKTWFVRLRTSLSRPWRKKKPGFKELSASMIESSYRFHCAKSISIANHVVCSTESRDILAYEVEGLEEQYSRTNREDTDSRKQDPQRINREDERAREEREIKCSFVPCLRRLIHG
jgi:hypothetical protein